MSKVNKDTPKILSENLFPVVGIGASAGGLDAFKKLVKAIPENSGMAYILVQHLHPGHESALPEILQRFTKIPVLEIRDNVRVAPDHIYVIPSNKTLVATDGILKLSPRSSKDRLNLPIDIFFSSLAEVHQGHAIGVVLSGTGADGSIGLKDIKDHGGLTLAQDPGSASYAGMPQHAIDASVVDFILSPEMIPGRLLELQQAFLVSSNGDGHSPKNKLIEDGFRKILALLRVNSGVDFSLYKQTTVRRRIVRRMAMLHLETIVKYLEHLKKNKPEQDILFYDLLISVTSFFRDPLTYDTLYKTIFPEIAKEKSLVEPLRIWVAGCSTGQEAYSIAMYFQEYVNEHDSDIKVQVFATDLSGRAIKKARSGIYTKKEIAGIPESRLQQFFNKIDGHYQVKKTIRDMCIFAVHNFLKDPPFAKIDFISCRNVLIYFDTFLQKKAFTIFHYALNTKGILWLGKSEAPGNAADLFIPLGKKEKFFTRKSVPGKFMHMATEYTKPVFTDKNYLLQNKEVKTNDFQKNADTILLSSHSPAAVVVNDQLDIVQFRGLTIDYLAPSPGKASLNVLKMAKEGLGFEIRNALHKAKTSKEAYIKKNIPLNRGKKLVSVEVIPLLDTIDPHFLILFNNQAQKNILNEKGNGAKSKKDEKDTRIIQLEKELAGTREDMRNISDDQESANEELQSSNEELLSGSEELQSLNEELETSKEELQSTNEELITVNQELYDRNEELNQTRKFAEATISILHEPLLVLDKNFLIISANESFYKIFGLTEDKTLGKILFELQDNCWDIPGLRKELGKIQREKQKMIEVEITFTFPFIGERIISFNMQPISRENGEQLILLALDDITLVKNAAQKREQKKDDFISIATHEMKTPLTTAKAYLQLLELSLDKSNEKASLYASKASLAVTRLNELITELLDVSKIQYGKLNYNITTFDFNEMIDDTVEDIQYSSPKHTLIKKGRAKNKITGDKDRLQQVIINLLTNAIKYSPEAGKIFIQVEQVKKEIKVSVKDSGIGIPKHHLEKIFDRYYRVEDHSVQFQGLGIGLFICYEIIQRHNGKLWAESEAGKKEAHFISHCLQASHKDPWKDQVHYFTLL